MTHEIITDRFEIEKLAEDIYLSDDKTVFHIDYADLRTLRRISTLKYGILCKVSYPGDQFVEEILTTIKSSDIPISDLKTYLISIRTNENERFIKRDLDNLLLQIQEIGATNNSGSNIDGLWTFNTNSSIPLGECYINIIFGINKTDEDKLEDEKHEQMIEEYRKSKLPPIQEFPCIVL